MHAPSENQIPSYYIVTAKSSLCTPLSVDDRRNRLNGKASRAIAEPDPMLSRTGVGKLGCRVVPLLAQNTCLLVPGMEAGKQQKMPPCIIGGAAKISRRDR